MAEWELNLADRETLRPGLIPRIKQSVIKYLLYTQGGGGSPSANRIAWCKDNLPNADTLAQQLSNYCMSEPTFIAGGTSISDAAIQSRVESVLIAFFMPA
jgi:hypothetical protein